MKDKQINKLISKITEELDALEIVCFYSDSNQVSAIPVIYLRDAKNIIEKHLKSLQETVPTGKEEVKIVENPKRKTQCMNTKTGNQPPTDKVCEKTHSQVYEENQKYMDENYKRDHVEQCYKERKKPTPSQELTKPTASEVGLETGIFRANEEDLHVEWKDGKCIETSIKPTASEALVHETGLEIGRLEAKEKENTKHTELTYENGLERGRQLGRKEGWKEAKEDSMQEVEDENETINKGLDKLYGKKEIEKIEGIIEPVYISQDTKKEYSFSRKINEIIDYVNNLPCPDFIGKDEFTEIPEIKYNGEFKKEAPKVDVKEIEKLWGEQIKKIKEGLPVGSYVNTETVAICEKINELVEAVNLLSK